MTCLKLETAIGLQFAEGQLVSNDIKGDDLGCLNNEIQAICLSVRSSELWQTSCTSLAVGLHFLLVKCVLKCGVDHTWRCTSTSLIYERFHGVDRQRTSFHTVLIQTIYSIDFFFNRTLQRGTADCTHCGDDYISLCGN